MFFNKTYIMNEWMNETNEYYTVIGPHIAKRSTPASHPHYSNWYHS